MNKSTISEKDQKMLFKALDKIKKERTEEKRKKFEKLFKKFGSEPNLEEALNSLTVAELKEMKNIWDAKFSSSAKKAEIVDSLKESMLSEVGNGMEFFDSERVRGFEAYAGIPVTEKLFSGMSIVTYFRKIGLLYPGVIKGNKMIFIPKELNQKFNELKENADFKKMIKKNDDILNLTRGYLHIYGVMSINKCIQLIEKKLGFTVTYEWLFKLLLQRYSYTSLEFSICGEYLCHVDVYDHMDLLEKAEVAEYDYKDFSTERIIEFGKANYGEDGKTRKEFKELLLKAYNMDLSDAEEIASACEYAMKNERDVQFIMEYLGHNLIIDDVDIYSKILKSLVDLKEDTVHWGLKGFTPRELEKAASKNKSLSVKVGRNDPCTCGSGKKYKKCCGKN